MLRGYSQEFQVGERKVGYGHPCFIVAEAGVNHNGDINLARQLVDAAAQAGADAVKFQTFKAERLVIPRAPKAEYQRATTGAATSQLDMLRGLELSADAHVQLIEHAKHLEVTFLSTPFDEQSADLLDELAVPLFKIPSGEITNLALLHHIARKGKPIILSTGMSGLGEVEEALRVIHEAGGRELVVLHCTSNYPADPAMCNLQAMRTMRQAFQVLVGYSDHTTGMEVAIAAVTLGATVIEKHFTLDRTLPGPDHRASLEPQELTAMVRAIRNVERALGDGIKAPVPTEHDTRNVARKSIVAALDLPAGTVLQKQHLTVKRPGTGIPPGQLDAIIGRTVVRSLAANDMIDWKDVQ